MKVYQIPASVTARTRTAMTISLVIFGDICNGKGCYCCNVVIIQKQLYTYV